MQFQVPQFIEVEDRIFGPLTFKQFVYVAGGLGASYIFLRILPMYVAAPLIFSTLGLSAALAFLQYNGRPFIYALEHGFFFLISSKLYLWSNKRAARQKADSKGQAIPVKPKVYVPYMLKSILCVLACAL